MPLKFVHTGSASGLGTKGKTDLVRPCVQDMLQPRWGNASITLKLTVLCFITSPVHCTNVGHPFMSSLLPPWRDADGHSGFAALPHAVPGRLQKDKRRFLCVFQPYLRSKVKDAKQRHKTNSFIFYNNSIESRYIPFIFPVRLL